MPNLEEQLDYHSTVETGYSPIADQNCEGKVILDTSNGTFRLLVESSATQETPEIVRIPGFPEVIAIE